MLATLCVALSVVFAAASATSVADHLQHETGVAHEHGLHLTVVFVDEHPADHHASHGYPDHDAGQDDGASSDPQPSAGHHHHADAPAGAQAGVRLGQGRKG